MSRLDSFTKDLPEVDLLKVDVEGFELFVLKGAEETLKKTKLINIEISDTHFSRYRYSCKEVLNFLIERGFECLAIKNGKREMEISSDYVPTSGYENILGIKNCNIMKLENTLFFCYRILSGNFPECFSIDEFVSAYRNFLIKIQ